MFCTVSINPLVVQNVENKTSHEQTVKDNKNICSSKKVTNLWSLTFEKTNIPKFVLQFLQSAFHYPKKIAVVIAVST